ncbi:hypothetical protein H8959_007349 [Pygathrix nigripes]
MDHTLATRIRNPVWLSPPIRGCQGHLHPFGWIAGLSPPLASSFAAARVTTDAASRAPPTGSWTDDWRKRSFLATSPAPAAPPGAWAFPWASKNIPLQSCKVLKVGFPIQNEGTKLVRPMGIDILKNKDKKL